MPTTINPSDQTITQYNIQTGGASNLLNNVAPSATSGVPVISQGAASQPVFGTAVVAGGGTGAVTLTGILTGNGTSAVTANAVTQHGVLIGGASNAASSLGVASTGTVLAGATGADPAFTATPAVTSITFGAGSALSTYVTASWTPAIKFGGASVGVTYNVQVGQYTQIGNVVHFNCDIQLSSKGSSTGNVSITGLPVNSGSECDIPIGYMANTTLTALYTNIFAQINGSGTFAIYQVGSGQAVTALTDVQCANSTVISFTGIYFT